MDDDYLKELIKSSTTLALRSWICKEFPNRCDEKLGPLIRQSLLEEKLFYWFIGFAMGAFFGIFLYFISSGIVGG